MGFRRPPSERARSHRPTRVEAAMIVRLLRGYNASTADGLDAAIGTVNRMGVIDARQTVETLIGVVLGLIDGSTGKTVDVWCDDFVAAVAVEYEAEAESARLRFLDG